jgi:DNA (cytosine-5)-methyltransferase 1
MHKGINSTLDEGQTPVVQSIAHIETMPTMTAGGPSGTSHNQVSGQMRDQYIVPTTTHTLRGEGFDASEDGTGRGTPLVPVAYSTKLHNTASNQAGKVYEEYATSLDANSPPPAVFAPIAFSSKDHGADATADLSPTLRAMGHADSHANGGGQMAVAQPIAFHPTQDPISSTDGTTHGLGCGSSGG